MIRWVARHPILAYLIFAGLMSLALSMASMKIYINPEALGTIIVVGFVLCLLLTWVCRLVARKIK